MKIALLSLLLATTFSFAGGLGFAVMENGDRIEATLHSTGCFHNSTYYYEVTKTDGTYQFREYKITWNKAGPPKMLTKKPLGTIKLTANEVAGLDKYLSFYRGKKEVSSTTQSSLLVEYFESGKRVKTEQLKDESGGHGLEQRKDIVTFYSLAARFENDDAERGNASQPAPAPKPASK